MLEDSDNSKQTLYYNLGISVTSDGQVRDHQ